MRKPKQNRFKEFALYAVEIAKRYFDKYMDFIWHLSPYQNLTYTVFFYTVVGGILLSLPFMSVEGTHVLDHFFTAASLVATGGLATVNFAESYTFAGKFVGLILIQICGIGYMTMTSFVTMSLSRKITYKKKEFLDTEFTLPQTFHMKDFLKVVVFFTAIVELAGTAVLSAYFHNELNYSLIKAIWYGAFHSISAFCTAGFSLFPNSLEDFADSRLINNTISILSLFGAIGFIVVTDVIYRVTGKTKQISYTSKVILISTFVLIAFNSVLIYGTEPALAVTFRAAVFQSIAALTTTGFNTVPLSSFTSSSLLLLILLMCIGASPSGTGGGIKTTTITAVFAIVYNRLLGRNQITFLGSKIPIHRLYIAVSSFIFYTIVLFISLFLLTYFEKMPFIDLFFEAASALGTVGLTNGVTPQLSYVGKIIIMITMLIGRVGVVTFGMAILAGEKENSRSVSKAKRDDLAV